MNYGFVRASLVLAIGFSLGAAAVGAQGDVRCEGEGDARVCAPVAAPVFVENHGTSAMTATFLNCRDEDAHRKLDAIMAKLGIAQ